MYVGYCLVSIFVSYTVHQRLSVVGKCERNKSNPLLRQLSKEGAKEGDNQKYLPSHLRIFAPIPSGSFFALVRVSGPRCRKVLWGAGS